MLELATHLRPGAFSPLLTQFVWKPYSTNLLIKTFSTFSLFLGPGIESLHINICAGEPTQVAALRYILNLLPPLKDLWVDAMPLEGADPFIREYGYLTSFPWNDLETLRMSDLTKNIIPYLSTLPRLTNLTLFINEPRIPLQYTSLSLDYQEILSMGRSGFESLQTLHMISGVTDATGFIQRLHPGNQIRHLSFTLTFPSNETDNGTKITNYRTQAQLFIQTLHAHMNPRCLRELDVFDSSESGEFDEPLELGSRMLDISPLFKFNELRELALSLSDGVGLTAAQASLVSASWPKIEALELENVFAGRQPRIDHVHLLEIATKCRFLSRLTLAIDASRVGEGDRDSGIAVCRRDDLVPALETLCLGHSPIESPSLVKSFLVAHFPKLKDVYSDRSQSSPLTKYEERWQAVSEALGDQ